MTKIFSMKITSIPKVTSIDFKLFCQSLYVKEQFYLNVNLIEL